jgi:hypothetical protein
VQLTRLETALVFGMPELKALARGEDEAMLVD